MTKHIITGGNISANSNHRKKLPIVQQFVTFHYPDCSGNETSKIICI